MSKIEHLCRKDLWCLSGYAAADANIESPLRLHCNENPWPPSSRSDSAINRYPNQQPESLQQRLSEIYDVTPGNILVTRGADDGIDAIIRGFCLPGQDAIVQCPPAFVMYNFFARLHQASVVNVPLAPETFAVDFESLRKSVDDGAKVVFLCSPNNPTGSLVPVNEALCFTDRVANRAIVVVDEAYIEFCGEESLSTRVNEHPNLIVLRTLSKAWSLAGARIGALLAHPEVIEYLLRAVVVPYPLSQESVSAALSTLGPKHELVARQRIAEIVAERGLLQSNLDSFRFVRKVYPSHANFLLIAVDDVARLMSYCRSHGILLRDQSAQPGLENHIRISVGTADEMQRLQSTLQRYEELV